METFIAGEYDIAVVGAGHAGCEAAAATAKMGFRTVLFAINLDSVANMACNPNIGGTAKGQLVREVDALGGVMGKIADKTTIQSKILNRTKGPAVYSLRAQIDRRRYQNEMKHALEKMDRLDLKQGEIVDILTEETPGNMPAVKGVVTHTGAVYLCKCAILCTGTYLKGKIILGELRYEGGPDGHFPANRLSERLRAMGFTIIRLKTGTPPRVNRKDIDFTGMEPQYGDEKILPFSFENESLDIEQEKCYLTHTTKRTHEIIMENIHRSPLFNGLIEGVGPRYCPSIEDKVMRFRDKERHQIFIEPMGSETEEMYLQGMSSSLPEEVQLAFVRSVPGLEKVSFMRPAYAIEYDAIDARELKLSLESRLVDGLFCAGQINGSSGYEEAAGQGIMAGINAALKLRGQTPLILDRSEGYIGVLIDDLVTLGTREPYRMMTSRAEYRLLLRQDNADFRLTEKAYRVGMISEERYARFCKKYELVEREKNRLAGVFIPPRQDVNDFLSRKGSTPLKGGMALLELLRRPELKYEDVINLERLCGNEIKILPEDVTTQVEINVKYEGYIKRQETAAAQFRKMEKRKLPENFDYSAVPNLSLEAREKLTKTQPESIGQAGRISGVSPADVTALMVYFGRKHHD